ncbi:MAG TPA: trypsin-like peptidase domain-containing protein [Candidatus Paceibacterota bacterium]|nr:trypsin-like peptidase domain-containing protein [Candidatus Paceibacterota bacterium]
MMRSFLFSAISLTIFCLGIVFFFRLIAPTQETPIARSQTSAVSIAAPIVATTTTSVAATTSAPQPQTAAIKKTKAQTTSAPAEKTVARVQNPYTTPPLSFTQVNVAARSAIVNILCQPKNGSMRPISASGVIIDPKGVILTNAHVGQYVLLSESSEIDLSCTIRTGSPSTPAWKASIIFIPPVWVNEHAPEINVEHPTGTGEHDYALLAITGSATGAALPSQFPYISPDTRAAIGFPGDQVLVASYPAEFAGGIAAQYGLYANSTVTSIKQLMTFASGTPDVISLGGVIEAQSGSSGGAVVNAWGKLIGLIATTSEGTTTAARDLRAVSLSYINTDLKTQSGFDLSTYLGGDPVGESTDFGAHLAPSLIKEYITVLSAHQ